MFKFFVNCYFVCFCIEVTNNVPKKLTTDKMAVPGQGLFFLFAVVMDFDGEDNNGANRGYDVGNDQRHIVEQQALDYEQHRAGAESQKRRHGYAVGLARAYGGYGLGQIAAYHANGGKVAENKGYIHGWYGLREKMGRSDITSTRPTGWDVLGK